jgi:uncharacterized protein (TIGR02391 family)
MYCVARFGKNKTDYLDGFQSLKDRYEGLWYSDEEEKEFSRFAPSTAEITINAVEKILKLKRLDDNQIGEISNLFYNFLEKEERKFRESYFDYLIKTRTRFDYPKELIHNVKGLLDDDHNDEAVVTSFKFLDNHLQKLLGLLPHDAHGEDLINKAFAPNIGKLQLGTSPNEQIGLRNFFSGANAIFRNPSAHRFMRFEGFDAAAIVAIVAVMARLATQISRKDSKKEL